MFDGRFDQHLAEVFATSLEKDADGPHPRWAAAGLLAATFGVISVLCLLAMR